MIIEATMNMRRRFQAIHADHKRIARGAAWVAIFVLIGKLAGAGKEMAVAYRYGVSGVVDAYQLATILTTWLPGTLITVLSAVLVPLLIQLRQQDADERNLFLRELQGVVLLLGLLLALASISLTPLALPFIAGQLSGETRQMAWQFTLGLAPNALLTLMIGVYAIRLMAREKQINTLLESMPAITILFFVLIWSAGSGIEALLWGTLLGFAMQTLWLGKLAHKADGDSVVPCFTHRSPHWLALSKAFAIMAAGQFVMSFIVPLDQYYAAQMGDGAIARLGYANRVIALLLGLGAMAISRAALPVLAELHVTGESVRAMEMASKWALLMLAGGLLVGAAGWLFAPLVIELLFQRGAFGTEETAIVTEVFRYGLVQIPFYFSGLVLVQLLVSRQRYGIIALLAVTNFFVKWGFNFTLTPVLGISGIALATGLTYAWSASCLYWATVHTRPAAERA